ncbi:DNA recombination protein RmuC [Halarcobacter bivalviorum]|uniref:DNA recombination protein n=1 Tax=Halarcobacter bivalviorum TaxID=663364 RepID=A0AAX2AC84_9BACT|nr:DNA recombination protein RmuC [Halarcobacter bivalviorum]AXH12385.1 DNA recombination protein [Halarcobacter bivalviorum]RXK10688.1 DNA recombination protein RmuC [Halarcobacter bivalviorum]
MENLILISSLSFVVGVLLASLVVWFILKQKIDLTTKELQLVKDSYENLIASLKENIRNLEESILNIEKSSQEKILLERKSYETKIESLENLIQDKKEQYENEFRIKEDSLKEKIELLETSKDRLKVEFENLANKLFEENNKKSSTNLNQLLTPFKDQLNSFGKRVNDIHNEETKQRVNLLSEIKNLKELNNQISQDALNLTKALKGENKTQGDWGELILSKILEQTGLREGVEYSTQGSYTDENGKRLRPDVIVHLPQNKDIVIDSKVSLTSYVSYTEAQDDTQRENASKELIKSLYTHIKGLSAKSYENIEEVKTLDFVIMFIPIEGAFMLAASKDNNLFKTAFENNIMLVSPSTLFATLRTIENIWRYEHQNENALLISKKAADLYDKFASFVTDIESIGTHLNRTQKSYDEAMKKLSLGKGNLLRRSEEFIELGVKAKKKIDTQKLLGE